MFTAFAPRSSVPHRLRQPRWTRPCGGARSQGGVGRRSNQEEQAGRGRDRLGRRKRHRKAGDRGRGNRDAGGVQERQMCEDRAEQALVGIGSGGGGVIGLDRVVPDVHRSAGQEEGQQGERKGRAQPRAGREGASRRKNLSSPRSWDRLTSTARVELGPDRPITTVQPENARRIYPRAPGIWKSRHGTHDITVIATQSKSRRLGRSLSIRIQGADLLRSKVRRVVRVGRRPGVSPAS